MKASNRRRRNNIEKLRGEDGIWVEDEETIAYLLQIFFVELYTKDDHCDMQHVLDVVTPQVTSDMNNFLTCQYTHEEIKMALT
ncbi:hypothetical protein ACS0TY_000918 [Phlomoides rotata]